MITDQQELPEMDTIEPQNNETILKEELKDTVDEILNEPLEKDDGSPVTMNDLKEPLIGKLIRTVIILAVGIWIGWMLRQKN